MGSAVLVSARRRADASAFKMHARTPMQVSARLPQSSGRTGADTRRDLPGAKRCLSGRLSSSDRLDPGVVVVASSEMLL